MEPMKFQSAARPVEVMQLTTENWWEVARWCDGKTVGANTVLYVTTSLGHRPAYAGDYIIRDEWGEFLPRPKEAFHNFYEEVPQ